MTEIESSIFRKYDIRGRAMGDNRTITVDAARLIGQAFGTYIQDIEHEKTVVVGRDNRHSSYDLMYAAIDGLAASGCDVIDIGLVSTPVLYWHAVARDNAGGMMITGSHLPPDQNGFKLSVGSRSLHSEQIQMLRSFIVGNHLYYGDGRVEADDRAYGSYIYDLAGRLVMDRALTVVIDAGNGTGGLFGPRLVQMWGHKVHCIYCQPDGNYPNHHPDPLEPQNMIALGEAVREHGADVGIAFDGDADRMGVVDERGEMIVADRVLALLAQDMLGRNPGAGVVVDVLTSQAVIDAIEDTTGQVIMSPTGHSLVKEKMRDSGALLGGEVSAHIFLAEDYHGFDDGYLAAGRLLQVIASSEHTLSALNGAIPTLYSTPIYRPYCPEALKDEVIDHIRTALANQGEIIDIDGVRIQFEKGWGLIRASNTEAVLTLRFEAESEADALAYRDLFAAELAKFADVGTLE
ncbi:MAG: phosphomannomutase [Phototrophicales bacterium]|nr:MAG: phosphomannomutase [Phototrophicales bacterium]